MIFDDPTSSLDNKVSQAILKNIKEDPHWDGKTVIFSTNNLGLLKYVDRVILVSDGKISQFDSPDVVKSTPEYLEITIGDEEEIESDVIFFINYFF